MNHVTSRSYPALGVLLHCLNETNTLYICHPTLSLSQTSTPTLIETKSESHYFPQPYLCSHQDLPFSSPRNLSLSTHSASSSPILHLIGLSSSYPRTAEISQTHPKLVLESPLLGLCASLYRQHPVPLKAFCPLQILCTYGCLAFCLFFLLRFMDVCLLHSQVSHAWIAQPFWKGGGIHGLVRLLFGYQMYWETFRVTFQSLPTWTSPSSPGIGPASGDAWGA